MAIIYSYPTNINIQPNDIVVGTSTIVVNGKAKNQTKSFPIVDLGTYINLSNTLDSVLTNGNTSLLDAKIGELYLWDGPNGDYAKISIQDSIVRIARAGGGTDIIYSDNGFDFTLNNGTASAQILNSLTTSRIYTLPNKNGTFAMLSDISGTNDLQAVTDVGNTTTNDINVVGVGFQTIVGVNFTVSSDPGFVEYVGFAYDGSVGRLLIASNSFETTIKQTTTSSGPFDFLLPNNKTPGAYTIATTADIASPLTTKGDLYTFSTVDARLPVGLNAQVLTADSSTATGLKWVTNTAVTSVGMTVPSAFSVTPSTITSSGTFAITGAGSVSQYVRGDGTLANFPTSTGLTTLNGLTSPAQYFAVGTTGTDFNISSATDTHTFNLPTASATNRGALSTTDWSTFNNKANSNTELNIRRTGYTVYNEFLASVTNGSYAQATVSAGTITSATGNVDENHFGVVTFNSSTTANSGYYSALNPSATVGISCTLVANLQTDLVFKTPVTISPTTTIRFGIGLGSITATDFTNGFYFEIVGNSLVGKTANVSVRSSSSAYTISADTWYHLRVIATSTTLITYYVYDMNGALLFSTTLNTNLPTTTVVMNNVVVATNSGVVATILGYFDLISITFPPMVRGALD